MSHPFGYECIRSIEIEEAVTSGRCLTIEDTSLPVHQNHFRSEAERPITPVQSERPAKRRNSWQRFVEFGKVRSHVVHFAVEPHITCNLRFDPGLGPNETTVRLRIVNNGKV